jgi:hypothetical protein
MGAQRSQQPKRQRGRLARLVLYAYRNGLAKPTF